MTQGSKQFKQLQGKSRWYLHFFEVINIKKGTPKEYSPPESEPCALSALGRSPVPKTF